jgi:hypothetical protein
MELGLNILQSRFLVLVSNIEGQEQQGEGVWNKNMGFVSALILNSLYKYTLLSPEMLLKVLTNEKRGGLKVVSIDRSRFQLFTLKFSKKSVQTPSCERATPPTVSVKGTVSRDFRLLVFFMNQFPPSICVYHYGHFKFFRKFAEIFEAQGAPPVSTPQVANGKNLQ